MKNKFHPVFLWVTVYISISTGALDDPFPMGHAMLNMGTIIKGNEISAREPWLSAGFVKDSMLFWMSAAFVNYYAAMDNLSEKDFRQAALGLGFNRKWLCVKGSAVLFNALGIYYEWKGFFSFGISAIPHCNISLDMEGYRVGLYTAEQDHQSMVCGGISLWSQWKYAAASLGFKNIPLMDATIAGVRNPFTISFGMHTMPHRFGSQGVMLTMIPSTRTLYRFSIGEEMMLFRTVSISVAVAAEPLMISLGICFSLPRYTAYSGLVYHPLLGWSQGLGMEVVRRKG
jgi:hypothetical protein